MSLGCYSVSVYHPRARGSPQGIDGAPDAPSAPVQNMGIDHGGLDVFMTEQLLFGPDIVTCFEQVCVPAQMRDELRNGGRCGGLPAWWCRPSGRGRGAWAARELQGGCCPSWHASPHTSGSYAEPIIDVKGHLQAENQSASTPTGQEHEVPISPRQRVETRSWDLQEARLFPPMSRPVLAFLASWRLMIPNRVSRRGRSASGGCRAGSG